MRATRPSRKVTTRAEASRVLPARRTARLCPGPPLQLRTKVWLERDGRFVIGDGGLQLLLAVEARGSLLAAARQIGWSYRHAWQYLRRAEKALGAPLVQARPGKGRRRGTMLTADGRCLLMRLREARGRLDRAIGGTGPTPEEVAARGRRRGGTGRGREGARDR